MLGPLPYRAASDSMLALEAACVAAVDAGRPDALFSAVDRCYTGFILEARAAVAEAVGVEAPTPGLPPKVSRRPVSVVDKPRTTAREAPFAFEAWSLDRLIALYAAATRPPPDGPLQALSGATVAATILFNIPRALADQPGPAPDVL